MSSEMVAEIKTVREFLASGRKGEFAQQLLRTYNEPCEGNFRLLRAVADGRNFLLVGEAIDKAWGVHEFRGIDLGVSRAAFRIGLQSTFPMLQELDCELTPAHYSRLPREAPQ